MASETGAATLPSRTADRKSRTSTAPSFHPCPRQVCSGNTSPAALTPSSSSPARHLSAAMALQPQKAVRARRSNVRSLVFPFESISRAPYPFLMRSGRFATTLAACSISSACQSACNIDGVDASSRRHRSVPRWWCDQPPEEEASMEQVDIIGIDLAKRSFQLHGARSDGSVAFRRKLSREKLLYFLAALPRCVVAMEACASRSPSR